MGVRVTGMAARPVERKEVAVSFEVDLYGDV
jgi:hypothetical protein